MKLTPAVRAVAAPILSAVAARYVARCSWAVDAGADLQQAAWEALLRAPEHDPARASLESYVVTVATRTMWRAVHKLRAPVSASHRVKVLAGLSAAELEYRRMVHRPDGHNAETPPSERPEVSALNTERADAGETALAVRARLRELLGAAGAARALVAYGVELTAGEQADAEGVPVMTVYRLRAKLKERLAADPVLLELWNE